jgi:hypothetical protein
MKYAQEKFNRINRGYNFYSAHSLRKRDGIKWLSGSSSLVDGTEKQKVPIAWDF